LQVDTLRYTSLVQLLVQEGKHVLLAGPTGEQQNLGTGWQVGRELRGVCCHGLAATSAPLPLPLHLHLTGTGKTVYVKDVLEGLDKTSYSTIQTAFSARTSANQTQVGGPGLC
jgi:hypothetical protein